MFFFSKKNLLQLTFEKNNLLCKKREKNNLSRGKIPAPPPWISNGLSLIPILNYCSPVWHSNISKIEQGQNGAVWGYGKVTIIIIS